MSQIFTLTFLVVQLLADAEVLDLQISKSLLGRCHFGLFLLTNLVIDFRLLLELNLAEF